MLYTVIQAEPLAYIKQLYPFWSVVILLFKIMKLSHRNNIALKVPLMSLFLSFYTHINLHT